MAKIDRRDFLKSAATLAAATITTGCNSTNTQSPREPQPQGACVMGLTVPPMEVVRIGFIGVGERGKGLVKHCCHIEGVEIKAICDTDNVVLESSIDYVTQTGRQSPTRYTGSEHAYRQLLARSDIDIVIIATPWKWHTPMSVETMESGKHAFVEVPAATTIEECWQLVNTSERTQMNCMMMENVNYGRDELMVLNMVRQGIFGDLLHAEAGYIHELRHQMKHMVQKTGLWRTHWHTKKNGNLYPTHGLGPVSQYMNINRGDRFDYVSSVSSPARGRAAYAKREFPADHPRNQLDYIAGDMNTSIIKTKLGRSIMVQHDTTTPRPYSRHNLIQGTNGVFAGFPNRIALESPPLAIQSIYNKQTHKIVNEGAIDHSTTEDRYHEWDYDMEKWRDQFEHPLWTRMGEEAQRNGGHGGMDFLMLWRMIYCLRNGQPLDQDVYDAAAWSSIFPLSIASVDDRSNSKTVPDFTRGAWRTGTPLGIVT